MFLQSQQDRADPIDKNEKQFQRINHIQKQLNNLCCQHDSLMPLLQLNNYQNSLNKWQNSLKTINKKIAEYQNKMDQLGSSNIKDTTCQQKNGKEQKPKQNSSIKKKIDQLKQGLQLIKKNSTKTNQENNHYVVSHLINWLYSEQIKINPDVNKFKEQSEMSIKEVRKYTEMSLALFKNQIMLEEMSENTKLANSRNLSQFSNCSEGIIEKIQQSIFGQLRKQLQAIRSGLGEYDLKDFHIQSVQRLTNQLGQINQTIQFLSHPLSSQSNLPISNSTDLQATKQNIKLIEWQIKGLKKKYLRQLNYKYLNSNDIFATNSLQKLFAKDINQLQETYNKIKQKFDQIDQNQQKQQQL